MTDHPIVATAVPLPSISTPQPAEYAAQLYTDYLAHAAMDTRRTFGQFFTPVAVARFMARLATSSLDHSEVRLLEPGAGTGVLTAAVCEQLPSTVESVHIDAYELHPDLADRCEQALSFTSKTLAERGVRCTFAVHQRDFVLENANTLTANLFGSSHVPYDIAIANPPYFKLQKDDPRAQAAAHVVHGQPNIYAVFMAIMAAVLRPGGTMVTITPRSFTAGDYFRRFREVLFSAVVPESIHLFESRRDAFRGDEVLQENVIVAARRRSGASSDSVCITSSAGVSDLSGAKKRSVPLADVVDRTTSQMPIYIPTSDLDENVIKLVRSWSETLQRLNLRVSTGPVVAFRAEQFLRDGKATGEELVPLLWLQNVKAMSVTWPAERGNKLQQIVDSPQSAYLLVPNRSYVIMRRFSAKEERRRLVAAPLLEGTLPGRSLGLENHLNYIYRSKRKMSRYEATGLAALLSSALVDRYFRISNGNTQVSAVELRHLPLPRAEVIEAIGRTVAASGNVNLDQSVHDALHVPATIRRELERVPNVEGG